MVGAAARANKATSPSAPAEGEKETRRATRNVLLFARVGCQRTYIDTCLGKSLGSARHRLFRNAASTCRLAAFRINITRANVPLFRVPISPSYSTVNNVVDVQHCQVTRCTTVFARSRFASYVIPWHPREERGGGAGQDGPVGAGGPDVPAGGDAPSSAERPKLKLAPRSKTAGQAATGPAAPAPASTKKASIFGGGKAHDEFAYEVRACARACVLFC